MESRVSKLVALSFLLCSLFAVDRVVAVGTEAACCNQASQCASMTDLQLFTAAMNKQLGMCYAHDRCEGCACDFYIKVSNYSGQKGYDGGTGCINGTPEQVGAKLRKLCEDGVCCCPQKVPTQACPEQTVWARDPVTKTCCEHSRPCTVPDGWQIFTSRSECEGGVSSVGF